MDEDLTNRVVPGASKGQVAFQARGLELNSNKASARAKPRGRRKAGGGGGGGLRTVKEEKEEAWEAASRKRRGQKETRVAPHSYVVRKTAAAPFWLSPGVQFGRSNCRGWFPTRQDWSARGIPQCIYVPLEPSTEDRVEAMRLGHERVVGLTLEEDEERLMRIAIRESAAESRRAYEKKYGTEAEREKRREAQAKAKVKAMAERESLQRDEEKQLMEVIKASLVEGPPAPPPPPTLDHRTEATPGALTGRQPASSQQAILHHGTPPLTAQQQPWPEGGGAKLSGHTMMNGAPPPPDDNERDGLAAAGGAAQLAGWAVRGSATCGAPGGGGVLPPAPPVQKAAWGAAGQASDGLSAEERELKAVLEASRIAEETRQREDAESKIAMDMALKMSMMETPAAPSSGERYGHGRGNYYQQPAATTGYPAQPPPLSTSATANGFRPKGGGWQGQQQPPRPAPNAGYSPMATAAAAAPPPVASTAVSPRAPGAYSAAGRPLSPRQQGAPSQVVPTRPPPADGSVGGGGGESAEGDEEEDGAARELRIALEEEEQYYGAKDAAGAGGQSPPSKAGASTGGGRQQEDELAWVLEQSRLEAEIQKSRMAIAEEGEEEMMAKVLEESRLEQEKRNAEQLEFQRAMQASLGS
ncbi:expressed unknown protein [Ectocarpus siliculosus]|uniref:Uncharacterized protein n=1 Tax=Ectocarpus siliculosus TaxID=2880 RepID=D7FRG7_ECTSI|nr:expressed unknown protein [Ectocarpus siliculosus]|eukprot:CBJ30758.1 expressed unknown protein [Ectocarpus siliculosus]